MPASGSGNLPRDPKPAPCLTGFHATGGIRDTVVIELPKGGYAPRFIHRTAPRPGVFRGRLRDCPGTPHDPRLGLLALITRAAMAGWPFLGTPALKPRDSVAGPDRDRTTSVAVLRFDTMHP
ncbi:MAG: hypothetical protein AAF317_18870, partial [Pseudomonadota bacterium]